MPADDELDPLDRWLSQQVRPLPPPSGTFELISKRARRRKIRKTVVSLASAAVVAAAVGVAVPVIKLNLSPAPTNASMASGSIAKPAMNGGQSALGTGTKEPSPAAPSTAAVPVSNVANAGSTKSPYPTKSPYLPPNYVPSSVTWDSLTTGWVMGPAGTPGHCANANPGICTSIARTDNGGQTWQGVPAPDSGGPMAATGVTGLRFLNATYGWAFGPELWATDDGGGHWHQVNTGGLAVTDLETVDGRAYALFGDCTPPRGTTGDTIANCTSYTLETAKAGSDTWIPVGGVPANLGLAGGKPASAVIELAGGTSTQPATGYLVAPDGTLYAGPLDGTAWHKAGTLPCSPGTAADDGLPQDLLLAPAGTTSAGASHLAMVCVQTASGGTAVYRSTDSGSTWTAQANVPPKGTASLGAPRSLTTLPDGTLILATVPDSGEPGGGIYLLSPGAPAWQAARLSDPSGKAYGFTYVGMTGATQGVALGGSPNLHAIWMTTDGGQSWQVHPIQS